MRSVRGQLLDVTELAGLIELNLETDVMSSCVT
jgi:hypothetical protein